MLYAPVVVVVLVLLVVVVAPFSFIMLFQRIFPGAFVSVPSGTDVIIDGSGSYDSDYPDTSSLSYNWTCNVGMSREGREGEREGRMREREKNKKKEAKDNNTLFLETPNLGACNFTLPDKPTVVLPGNQLVDFYIYKVSLQLTSPNFKEANVITKVDVTPKPMPVILFQVLKDCFP